MVYKPRAVEPEAAPGELGVERELVTLTVDGSEHPLERQTVVIGRSKDCDIRVADPNVSRRHAEVRQEGTAYWLVDLGSTNGTSVNGRRQQRAKLDHDDRITLGSTELVFRRTTP
jgi:pSer/pThr/pTyr-binding forkhead associated (FHA) protein